MSLLSATHCGWMEKVREVPVEATSTRRAAIPPENQIDDAAEGVKTHNRPHPLRQVAHGIGAHEVGPAVDDEAEQDRAEQEERPS